MSAPAISYDDRLLAEAVRHLEADGASPIADDEADQTARERGGSLEARIVTRASRLHDAAALRGAIGHVRHAAAGVVVAALGVGLAGGVGVARVALGGGSGEPVNVFWALLGLLGAQSVLLAAWLVAAVARPRLPAGGTVGGLVLGIARRLAGWPHDGPHEMAAVRAVASVWTGRGIGSWTLGSVTHAVWVAFNLGCCAMLILLLSTRQYTFVWETTILSERSYVPLTEILGIGPRAAGFTVPDREEILASRGPGESPTALRGYSEAWSGLLLGTVALYGLAPRMLLLGLCLGLRRRAGRRYRLDVDRPGFARLRHRLVPGTRALGVAEANESPAGDRDTRGAAAWPVGPPPGGPPAVVGFELAPPAGPWPPPVEGVRWTDLGFVDDRASQDRALERLRAAGEAPGTVGVVCALTTTPDRGVRRFLEALRAAGTHRLILLLTAGHALRERTTRGGVEQRIDDWRATAAAAGIGEERVVEVDLDHLTAQSVERIRALVAGRPATAAVAAVGRLAEAFDLIVQRVARGDLADVGAQAELHREIARRFRADTGAWTELLHAPARLTGDLVPQLGRSAGRVVALLPARLRLQPTWMAAGALAGALGCVAAATLVSPVAIGALPVWSGLGAAIATVLRGARAAEADTASAPGDRDPSDSVRAAALFAVLLALQGRDEAAITRLLDATFADTPEERPPVTDADVRRWLDETRHRLDRALARERT